MIKDMIPEGYFPIKDNVFDIMVCLNKTERYIFTYITIKVFENGNYNINLNISNIRNYKDLKVSDITIKRAIKKLIEKDVIAITNTKDVYIANEIYFMI